MVPGEGMRSDNHYYRKVLKLVERLILSCEYLHLISMGNLSIKVNENENYLDKVVKLVPAEAISAYLALINIANAAGAPAETESPVTTAAANATAVAAGSGITFEVWASFGIALGILLVVRCLGSLSIKPTGGLDRSGVDKTMVVISIIAYGIWVYTIGGSESGPFQNYYSLFWGTAALIVFTFLAPYFLKGGNNIGQLFGGKPATSPPAT
jgi:hypothetical protein